MADEANKADATRSDFRAWRNATKDTTPFHLWKHAVELETMRRAARMRVSDAREIIDEPTTQQRLARAYSAGEPVWCFTDELAFRVEQTAVMRRADREADHLSAFLRAAVMPREVKS